MIFFGHIGLTLLFAYVIFHIFREKIDWRLLVFGAILPDLIDKPIGHYLFYSTFQNGRIFAHTMLFIAVLVVLAVYAEKKYRFTGISVLALGALMHLTEDELWERPVNVLWPLLGWQFPKLDITDYSGYILDVLLHEPSAYVPEIIGLTIIAGFVIRFRLYKPENVRAVLFTGHIPAAEMAIARQSAEAGN